MSDDMIVLYDVFPDFMTNGLLYNLGLKGMPWGNTNNFDLGYMSVSGEKLLSPILTRLTNGQPVTSETMSQIVNTLIALYGKNWQKLYLTLELEYNPIENYDMTETSTDSGQYTHGHTINRTANGTLNHEGTDTNTPNVTQNSNENYYGFNSPNPTPVGTGSTITSGNDTTTSNATDTNTETENTTNGGTDTNSLNHTLSRHGNIGVTTSQQMIESERNLWMWNFYMDEVFKDIDKFLTLAIY